MSAATTIPADSSGSAEPVSTDERADLLQILRTRRFFLLRTVRDLTDEQANRRTTVSSLTLGGLIKHVNHTEQEWVRFIEGGAQAMMGGRSWDAPREQQIAEYQAQFVLQAGETLAGVLADYAETARATDDLVGRVPDLGHSWPLPSAPWFEPGARWSVRQCLLHIATETAQHAGHADILRESLDGAKTMG